MSKNGWLTLEEIKNIGFKSFGEDLYISETARFYCPEKISIGNHVRIDDYCVLIGNIQIEDFIHIGTASSLHASKKGKIIMDDFSGVSANVTIYASTGDYSGNTILSRPGIRPELIKDVCNNVYLGKYSQVGTGSVVLQDGRLNEGTVVGAMSLVNSQLPKWTICYGIPCKPHRNRNKSFLQELKEYL